MGRILRLLALVVVAYFVIVEVVPYVRGRVEGVTPDKVQGLPDPAADESGFCVHRASQTNLFVVRELRLASQPPGDVSGWAQALDSIDSQLRGAENACTCPGQACEVAMEALTLMRGIVEDFDRIVRGDARYTFNLANRQEQVDVALERARAMLP